MTCLFQKFCGAPNIQLNFSWSPAPVVCNVIHCSFVIRVSFVMNRPQQKKGFLFDLYHKITNLFEKVIENYNTGITQLITNNM